MGGIQRVPISGDFADAPSQRQRGNDCGHHCRTEDACAEEGFYRPTANLWLNVVII